MPPTASLKDEFNKRLETEAKWLASGAAFVTEAVETLDSLDKQHKDLKLHGARLAPWPHAAEILRLWSDAGFIRIPHEQILDMVACETCLSAYHNMEPWMIPMQMHKPSCRRKR